MLKRIMTAFISCVDKMLICAINLLHDNRGAGYLPTDLIAEIARCLLPDVVKYCESEEGKAEFAKWQQEQNKK